MAYMVLTCKALRGGSYIDGVWMSAYCCIAGLICCLISAILTDSLQRELDMDTMDGGGSVGDRGYEVIIDDEDSEEDTTEKDGTRHHHHHHHVHREYRHSQPTTGNKQHRYQQDTMHRASSQDTRQLYYQSESDIEMVPDHQKASNHNPIQRPRDSGE